MGILQYCTKHFDQTRDAAQQEEEEECADSIWKKLRLREFKKSFASSTKMDFIRQLNELKWECSSLGVPWRVSIVPNGIWRVQSVQYQAPV